MTLVNIDESTIQWTFARRMGWVPLKRKGFYLTPRRLNAIGIIAALSSQGEFYFTITRGRNNSHTLLLFLVNLVKHFNRFKPNWRANTVFMLDNAQYHRSDYIRQRFLQLGLSVMYLGPY